MTDVASMVPVLHNSSRKQAKEFCSEKSQAIVVVQHTKSVSWACEVLILWPPWSICASLYSCARTDTNGFIMLIHNQNRTLWLLVTSFSVTDSFTPQKSYFYSSHWWWALLPMRAQGSIKLRNQMDLLCSAAHTPFYWRSVIFKSHLWQDMGVLGQRHTYSVLWWNCMYLCNLSPGAVGKNSISYSSPCQLKLMCLFAALGNL